MHEFHKQTNIALCLHADAPKNCSNKIVRAHTVQNSGSLSAIAEDGHVLSGRDTGKVKTSIDTSQPLASIGVNTASTFRGFCTQHDNCTFQPADTATIVTKEVAFLLSYRSLSYEIYMKMIAIRTMEALRNKIDGGLDYPSQAKKQLDFHLQLQGFQAGLRKHQAHKANYDRLLKGLWQNEFQSEAFSFNCILPIVSSGTFFPEYDFQGNLLQNMNVDIDKLSLLSFNIMVIDQKSVFVFGWDVDPTGANSKFAESFAKLGACQMANAAVRFCFETSDNIFVRPSWWTSVSKPLRDDLIYRLRQNTPGSHSPDGLTLKARDRYIAQDSLGGRINL